MISIGIDPGLHGAVVVVDKNFSLVEYYDCPIIAAKKGKKGSKNEFAPAMMADIVRSIVHKQHQKGERHVKAWLEKAGAMPKQGLSSTFKTGRGFGLWEGILAGVGVRYDIVKPTEWTKEMFKGTPLGDTKSRSFCKTQRLFPDLPLTKPKGRVLSLDGRSDAALIAYYGMIQMRGGPAPKKRKVPGKWSK